MPKQRVTDDEIDVETLEDADYSNQDFDTYDGFIPPSDTILTAYLKSMWWTRTINKDRMFKVLVVAADNKGDLEEYNGLPMWENIAMIPEAKFMWAPLLEQFGFTVRDIKTKLYTDDEEHPQFGFPVTKIGTFAPGSDESWCRVITRQGSNQNGDPRAEVKKWLDYEADEDEEEEPEEPEEDEEETEVDEEEEEEAPPARGRKPTAAKPAAKTSKPTAAATSRPSSRRAAPARSASAKASPAKASTRGRGRAAVSDDEPPF